MIRRKWDRVVPLPKKVEFGEDLIELGNDWNLVGVEEFPEVRKKWSSAFRLSEGSNDKAVSLTLCDLDKEAYEISISDKDIKVRAGSEVGFDYALETLWQLSPDGRILKGEIADSPDLKMRGFHVNFDSYRQMDIHEAKYAIKNAAKLKLNTILLEYAERFPYEKHSSIKAPSALSKEEVEELVETARGNNIEVIPLQQSIGHLNYLLRHDKYAWIREEDIRKDQLCPLNPDAFKVFTELAEEVIQLHPGIRYFHIGGDEARRLGTCPKCKEKVEKYGVSRLYIDYINSVSQWLSERGLTPIIWDDMLCAHPEALDDLDRRITIMYWEYWTTSKESPYFIARYNRRGQPVTTYDERWDSEWTDELTDLERSIMKTFARGVPLEESLGKEFMDLYGPYLGDKFPKRIKGYPYLEFYMDKGFKVIGAPTTLGNGDSYHTLPNYWRFIPNIRTACERAHEAGAEGVITTAWYNYIPLMFHFGLAATAHFAWGLPEERRK